VAGFTGLRRFWKDIALRGIHLWTIPERKVQLLERFFSLKKVISKLLITLTIPYCRERVSEDVAKTHLLDPVVLPAKNSLKRRRQRRVEIDAGRNFSIDRDVKGPERILLTNRNVDGR
jgi:hypothetical protein